ncbi:MAG: toll/interleukin-1 receptor domain-containing protein [Clostridia bacterium]|nr:toll/interleukin-1 receptor domain-containing protein [Clostridia bacterium]
MPTYKGNEKYIFVSYAHKDSEKVLPVIEDMQRAGFRVWYDTGIEAGTEWPAYIEESLEKSAVVLAFISTASIESVNCRNEINYALLKHKEMLVIYLENAELKYGLGLQLNALQSLYKFRHSTERGFLDELMKAKILQECKRGGVSFEEMRRMNVKNGKKRAVLKTVLLDNEKHEEPVVTKNERKYGEEVSLMDSEKYAEAISVFEPLEGYKDSNEKIGKCNSEIFRGNQYNKALELMNNGKHMEAIAIFETLDGYKDSYEKARKGKALFETKAFLEQLKIGNTIKFGAYRQNSTGKEAIYRQNNTVKEAIEWQVLDIKDGRALLISKYALDCIPYHSSIVWGEEVTWEHCTLRKWLNNDFLHDAFSENERAMIPTVTVSAEKNFSYGKDSSKETQDKIFLFSIFEAHKYFLNNESRKCKPTAFAQANGAWSSSEGNCRWWLRSIVSYHNAAYVLSHGTILESGLSVDSDSSAVRPALWIDLNA